MPRLTHTVAGLLTVALMMLASSSLYAFEQGTYFIYQLVEQSDAPTINKRLALDRSLFTEEVKADTAVAAKPAKRSEFEINYNSLGTSTGSGFKSTSDISSTPQTPTESSSFNLGTNEPSSLFGN